MGDRLAQPWNVPKNICTAEVEVQSLAHGPEEEETRCWFAKIVMRVVGVSWENAGVRGTGTRTGTRILVEQMEPEASSCAYAGNGA